MPGKKDRFKVAQQAQLEGPPGIGDGDISLLGLPTRAERRSPRRADQGPTLVPLSPEGMVRLGRVISRLLQEGPGDTPAGEEPIESVIEALGEGELAEVLSVMLSEAPRHVRNSDHLTQTLVAVVRFWQLDDLGPGLEEAAAEPAPGTVAQESAGPQAQRVGLLVAVAIALQAGLRTTTTALRALLGTLATVLPARLNSTATVLRARLHNAAMLLTARRQALWAGIGQGIEGSRTVLSRAAAEVTGRLTKLALAVAASARSLPRGAASTLGRVAAAMQRLPSVSEDEEDEEEEDEWVAREPPDLDLVEEGGAAALPQTEEVAAPTSLPGAAGEAEVETAGPAAFSAGPRIPRGQVPALAAALEDVGSADEGFGFLVLYGAYAPQERKGCEFRVAGMGLAQLSRGLAKWFNQAGRPDFPLQVIDDGAGELKVLLSLNGSRDGQ